MSSENTKSGIVVDVTHLAARRVVGKEDTSSIIFPRDEYNYTKNVTPQVGGYVSTVKGKALEDGAKAMDDNKLLEKYMDKVDQDQRDLRNELKERELRIEKQISEAEKREKERMDRIENLIAQQNEKIDGLKDEVSKQLEDEKKYRHNNNIAIVAGVVATVVALAGIYFATISTITDVIGLALPNM